MVVERWTRVAQAGLLALCLLAALPLTAGQLSLEQYNGLKRGMSESEVFYRVGEPDRITVDGVDVEIGYGFYGHRRELHYIPAPEEHDPQLTIVHIRNGRVASLERIKLLTRAPLPPPPAQPRSDEGVDREHEIRSGRAERTLDAAERYSEVRARLKAENGARAGDGAERPLFRGQGRDGVPYYGDRPPSSDPDPQ